MSEFEIHGTVADGFEAVREEFTAAVAAEDGESGAQLAAYVGGRQVVDLWAGDGVTGGTLTGVYSSTKGAVTLVVALLAQDGVLDLEEPVAGHWPEFAAFWANVPGPHSITGIGYGLSSTPPLDQVAFINTRRVRALGQASAGGVGSARGLAAMYAAAVCGVDGHAPLLKPDTLGEFAMLHSTGGDLVVGPQGQYALGFQAKGLRYPFLSARAFGHDGSAGSEAFADPRSGIAFGYTRRRFSFNWSYPEHDRLAAAVHHAAAAC